MTTNAAPIGKAIYLEFVKPGMVTQVLILPEGTSTSHRQVPMTMFRRKLSVATPRKTWRMISAPVMSTSSHVAVLPKESRAAEMLMFVTPLMTGLQRANWELLKSPIFVEVTAEDLEFARLAKTPYKTVGRVLKVRKLLGFPKDIIPDAAPAPAPAPAF